MQNLFSSKCTTHLKQVLSKVSATTEPISVVHLLDALAAEKGSIAAELLNKSFKRQSENSGQSAAASLESSLEYRGQKNSAPVERAALATKTHLLPDAVTRSLVKAVQISHQHGHRYIGTEHLLSSIIVLGLKEANLWLLERNMRKALLEKNLRIVLESTAKFPDLTAVFRDEGEAPAVGSAKPTALEYFGRELTSQSAQKDIDPLIGREREITRLVHILCRRHKNNPLLLGEAGVGKTAIVEGLAKRIAEGEVPAVLANKKIISLDLGAMVAGTMYRGEFEARLKQAIETAEKDKNVILFIDEIHTVIGAGAAMGSLDAANMLKPALARGALSVIGATTLEEYKKHIQGDSALERRLAPIAVDEPSLAETREVLLGIKKNYETYHNVDISIDAIDAAIEFSNRFLPDRLQPDKSIDLVDEAASSVKVERTANAAWKKVRQLERELVDIQERKKAAVSREDYSEAINAKRREAETQGAHHALLAAMRESSGERITVTREHVAGVVSALAHVPLGLLTEDEREKLQRLEEDLGTVIVGQDEALAKIASLIRRSRTGVSDPNRPAASLLFMGPTGVGKTETARQLAAVLFGSSGRMIGLDMSEYAEPYSISKLIGSPAGYVGYRDQNAFSDKVRAQGHAVILLDEIEKAHPEVLNMLLQILEEGQLRDATGRAVNFRNSIIIMTSNTGQEAFNQAARLGFHSEQALEVDEAEVRGELKERFRPEFLNRIDATIIFKPLTREVCRAIVAQHLGKLNERLGRAGVRVEADSEAIGHVVAKGYQAETGARGIRRYFQDRIEAEIARLLLAQAPTPKSPRSIVIDASDDTLIFRWSA
ncbi:MAG: ATP-dependent Clp protease ATP-binding subunit [Parcubacteria group bacterium]|nr:ATP-dependent Clp protease ATP-binding subunit [Parcubacteria group bacterium]